MTDLSKLLDALCNTDTSTGEIGEQMERLEHGVPMDIMVSKRVLTDLAMIRYNYTINRVVRQIVEIMGRTWGDSQESIRDMKRAKKLLSWLIAQVTEFGLSEPGYGIRNDE